MILSAASKASNGMQKEYLDRLKEWFGGYVRAYYVPDDGFVNQNLHLKECHTRRVCAAMRQLSAALAICGDAAVLAEAIALLHDVGRFPQFAQYRTYKDTQSVNHCLLGVQMIDQHRLLEVLPQDEQAVIRAAVTFHGAKEIPPVDDRTRQFTQMIRDTDKLDIFCLCTENYRRYHQDKQAFPFEVEFVDSPDANPAILESILNRQTVDYRLLKTLTDAKLLQMGWVFDTYFDWTLRQMRDRGYLDGIARWLPDTPQVRTAADSIFAYVAERLGSSR